MRIMGIYNKVAGALAPLILGAIMLGNADALVDTWHRMSVAQQVYWIMILCYPVILTL